MKIGLVNQLFIKPEVFMNEAKIMLNIAKLLNHVFMTLYNIPPRLVG